MMEELESLLMEFFADRGYRPTTRKHYAYWLRRVAREFPQALEASDTWQGNPERKMAFREWFENLALDPARGKQLIYALRSFLRWLYGEHPLHTMRFSFPEPPLIPTELNEEAALRLLRSFNRKTARGIRDFALATLWMDTGLRVVEMSRLTINNVDLERRTLQVEAKGGVSRLAIFGEAVSAALQQWLNIRPLYAREGVEAVFVSLGAHRGKGLTREGLKVIVRKWGKRIGIRLGTHDFRRFFATTAARHGASEVVIARAGGWKTTQMIRRYTASLRIRDIEPYLPSNTINNI